MRQSKDKIYKDEQKIILNEILTDIGVYENKMTLSRDELETEEFKEKMNNKYDEIKKYYKISCWNSVKNGVEKELNLLKNICRHNGIIIYKIQRKKNIDATCTNYPSSKNYQPQSHG